MSAKNLYSPLGILISAALLTCLGAAYGRTCERHQFWDFNQCMNCTECVPPDVVITPCQGHRDTICGPLSDLKIDWSWMRRGRDHRQDHIKEMTETFKENMQEIRLHELHVKEKERMLKRLQKHRQEYDSDEDSILPEKQKIWDRLKALGRNKEPKLNDEIIRNLHTSKMISEHPIVLDLYHNELLKHLGHFSSQEAKMLLKSVNEHKPTEPPKNEKLVKNFGFFPVDDDEDEEDNYDEDNQVDEETTTDPEVSEKELEFSTTEKIVLDYQTGVIYLAIGSIVIFFAVALCYTLKHFRTWGNYNYREDLEELKNWIWEQSHKRDTKTFPSTIYKTTTEVVSREQNGNCKYLERIISKNARRKINRVPQNVYQGAHPSMETRPLTASADELHVHKPIVV